MNKPLQHISFVMDGNRRWAQQQGLLTTQGHKQGLQTMYSIVQYCINQGIDQVSVYAFSSENWNRTQEEISGLVDLLRSMVSTQRQSLLDIGARICFVGDHSRFDDDIQDLMHDITQQTEHHKQTVFVCLSYGGHHDLVHAAQQLLQSQQSCSVDNFQKHLLSRDMNDIDLLIRTGGRRRLSNFLPWQTAYAELCFIDVLWPDFDTTRLQSIIESYHQTICRNNGV